MDKRNIELKHEAIQELLGNPPGWLTRWGITVFFGVIAALLTGCYFFQYPDMVTAPVVVTTEHPVAWIVAKGSGNIDSIYTTDKMKVKKKQVIATLGCAADFQDIEKIKQYLDLLRQGESRRNAKDSIEYQLEENLQAGELQDAFFQLLKVIRDYNVFCQEQVYQKKIRSIEYELGEQRNYLSYMRQQADIQQQNLRFINRQFQRDSMLYLKQMMSDAEYERAQQQLLAGKMQLNQSYLGVNNSEVNIARLEQGIRECRSEYNNEVSTRRINLQGAIDKMSTSIDIWEQTYLFRSPIDGVVSFSNYWSKNQFVSQGEKVFAVVAESPGEIIGKCVLPVNGAGKVETGQSVNIKLDGYPYMEYGMLQGKVKNVSLVATDVATPEGAQRFIVAEISLDHSLVTTYRKELPFNGEMSGVSEILTKEMSLLEHFVNPLRHLWSRMK